jgi:predicted KAP-like P-loop ATPase
MFMLHVEAADLPDEDKNKVREAIGLRLQESWKGLRVDAALVEDLGLDLPDGLLGKLQEAERLTPLMTKAQKISGNPRLIKRFMNSLAIRMALARRQKITVDEEVLAKLLLFERLASWALYSELAAEINDGIDGKPAFLRDLEWQARGTLDEDEKVSVPAPWAEAFPQEWLRLDPELHDVDMRGAMYVSREHLPVVTSGAALSPKSAELLAALVDHPTQAETLADELARVPAHELESMFDHFLDKARREQEWGANPLLPPLLVLSSGQPALQNKLSGFFAGLPGHQIKAALIVKIQPQEWSTAQFARWKEDDDVDTSVKNAISARTKKDA